MLQPLYDLIRPYWPVLLAFVIFPLLTAAANWWLWWDTPAQWDAFAAAHPSRARWVRRLRAIAPHLRKLVEISRDAAVRHSAPGARTVVAMLSPGDVLITSPATAESITAALSTVDLAAKAGAIAVSETRPDFDPTATITVTPEMSAAVRAIEEQRGQRGQRGYATVRALLGCLVIAALATVIAYGCGPATEVVLRATPGVPAPSACAPNAQRCTDALPEVCSSTGRWWPALARSGSGEQRVCPSGCAVTDGGVAYCLAEGGAR